MLAFWCCLQGAWADGADPARLGVLFNIDQPNSSILAQFYAQRRGIPAANVLGVALGHDNVLAAQGFSSIRKHALDALPGSVDSLALVWSRPFAVGCMSITTAFAAGYSALFCAPGCALTAPSPLFDSDGWLPADTVGWFPAMLIPTDDDAQTRALIERGIASDGTMPKGTVYLVKTADSSRNVRAATYADAISSVSGRIKIVELTAPFEQRATSAIGYFTGASVVNELRQINFLPGAAADHLTSAGGVLSGGGQMPATAWLVQGATASYGTVSEPCNHLEKFPDIAVFLKHYRSGESVLESYWKSVQMPGQGLFIGEPLARPYAVPRR